MSLRTPIASTSKLLPPLRAFSTSLPRLAKPSSSSAGSPSVPQQDPWDIRQLEEYKFDDTTTVGHMILERQREELRSLMAIEQDRELLQQRAQQFPFSPPSPRTHPLRLTSFLNLSNPLSSPPDPLSFKRKLRVSIAHLPLKGEESVKRFKLLAGSRWVLPKPEEGGEGQAEGREGWFEMSEEGWRDGRMNRKWLSDVLDKLIEEANNPSSPITPLPLPPSPLPTHHTSRLRKQKNSGKTAGMGHSVVRREAARLNGRGGGVGGFPEEWL